MSEGYMNEDQNHLEEGENSEKEKESEPSSDSEIDDEKREMINQGGSQVPDHNEVKTSSNSESDNDHDNDNTKSSESDKSDKSDKESEERKLEDDVKSKSGLSRSGKPQNTSIVNFNPEYPANFTDPYTLKAMERLGVKAQDLQYPTEQVLNEYSHNPRIRNVARKSLCADADALIEDVKKMRERLISRSKAQKSKSSDNQSDAAFSQADANLQNELSMMQMRQRRGVESMLIQMIKEDEIVKTEKLRKQREIERNQKREADLRKKKADEEKEREKRKAKLERKEHERKMKTEYYREAQIAKDKQKMEKLEQAKNEKKRQREQQREQQKKQAEEQQEKVRKRYQELTQRKIQESRLRQLKADERLKEFEQNREKNRELQKQKEQKRMEEFEQKRQLKERVQERKNDEIRRRNYEADLRYQKLEQEKMERINNAVIGKSENQLKRMEKIEKIRKEKEEENMNRIKAFEARELKLQQQHEKFEDERQMKAIELRLSRERKVAAAQRAERRREAEKVYLKDKFEAKVRSLEENLREKENVRRACILKRREMDQQTHELKARMAQIKILDDNKRPVAMEELANEYGLSIEELRERVVGRDRGNEELQQSSHLPPLKTPSNNNTNSSSNSIHSNNSKDNNRNNHERGSGASKSSKIHQSANSVDADVPPRSNLPKLNKITDDLCE